MPSIKSRLVSALIAVAAMLLVAPAAASAADYCVGPVSCPGGTPEPDLQSALDAAKATTSTADRVLIGPGTYSQLDGFSYSSGAPGNSVDVIGVGTPKPTLTMTTDSLILPAVLEVSQFESTVSNLDIDIPASGNNSRGLLMAVGVSADGIDVSGNYPASQQTGIQIGGVTVKNSTVNVATSGSGVGVYVNTNTDAKLLDSTIVGTRALDLASASGSTITLDRDRISASGNGLYIYNGSVVLANSLIDLQGSDGAEGIVHQTIPGALTTTVAAHNDTIRNGGAGSTGIDEYTYNDNSSIDVNLTDSIIRDVTHPIVQQAPTPGSTYRLTADHDDYDASAVLPASPGSGQVRNETNLLNVDPLFRNPVAGANGLSGDYRLSYNSPVIDQGDTAAPGTGETDLAGLPRIVDGAAPFNGPVRDLGAYEYQHATPVASAGATPTSAATGEAVSFDGSGSSDLDAEALTYDWSFDDGGVAGGPLVSHTFATAGTHQATLTVTDPSGLSAVAVVPVAVASPPPATTPAATPAVPASSRARKCKKHKKHGRAAAAKKCKKR